MTASALGSGCETFVHDGRDYTFCDLDRSWSGAEADCVALGMSLVRIDSQTENDFVDSHLPDDSWIGASDSAAEGQWRWSDNGAQFWAGKSNGSAVSGLYSRWKPGQPDDFLFAQDCARIDDYDGRWEDRGCGELNEYVCERIVDLCPSDPNKGAPGTCGCGVPDADADGDGTLDCQDSCPSDPKHTVPGQCGCLGEPSLKPAGTPCSDGLCSANDECDGQGSCGFPAECAPSSTCTVKVHDGHAYAFCPVDKSWPSARSHCQSIAATELVHVGDAAEDDFIHDNLPAPAWIGATDSATEGTWKWSDDGSTFWSGLWNGAPVNGAYANWHLLQPDDFLWNEDCAIHKKFSNAWLDQACGSLYDYVCEAIDECPDDDAKLVPGTCGCGNPDVDSDGDGPLDCQEACPNDPNKQTPGTCGCGSEETDSDFDGQPDCLPCAATQLGAAWPMSGHCRGGARRSPFVGAQTADENWSLALQVTSTGAPAIGAGGIIYLGTATSLQAVNPNGSPLWLHATAAAVRTSPAIDAAGRLYFGAGDGVAYAVRADTGALLWTFSTGSAVGASPTLTLDGTVLVANDAGTLSALDPGTGALLWSFQTGGATVAAPTVAKDGRILLTSTDRFVYALRPEPGLSTEARVLWATDLGAATRTSATLAAVQAAAYVGTDAGKLIKLRTLDGSIVWEFATGAPVRSSAALGALGTIAFGSDDGHVYALEDRDALPLELWRFQTGAPVRADLLTGADGTVYGGSSSMYALKPLPNEANRVLWQKAIAGGVRTAASIGSGGTIYFASDTALFSLGAFSASCVTPEVCVPFLGVNYCGVRAAGTPFFYPPDCPASLVCRDLKPCVQLLGHRFCYLPCNSPASEE